MSRWQALRATIGLLRDNLAIRRKEWAQDVREARGEVIPVIDRIKTCWEDHAVTEADRQLLQAMLTDPQLVERRR